MIFQIDTMFLNISHQDSFLLNVMQDIHSESSKFMSSRTNRFPQNLRIRRNNKTVPDSIIEPARLVDTDCREHSAAHVRDLACTKIQNLQIRKTHEARPMRCMRTVTVESKNI